MASTMFSALWESILVPREIHAILKYKLTAPVMDTSLPTTDAVDILSDFDFAYLCLAKFSPSIAEIILSLNREVRDSACVFYLFSYAMDAICDDPDLDIDRKITILTQFPQSIKQPNWKLEGIGSTDNERQFLSSFFKIISFYNNNIDQKFHPTITTFINKASQLHITLLNTAQNQISSSPTTISTTTTTTTTTATTTSPDNSISTPTQLITTTPHLTPLGQYSVESIDQYNQHAMLRTGLLFECVDQLFIQTGLMLHAAQGIVNTSLLAASAGIFVQKVNLIRNYRKNLYNNRTLWPAEIWSLYSQQIDWFVQHHDHIRSRLCLNHMILDALKHGLDAIQYLTLIQHHLPTFTFMSIQVVTAFTILGALFNNTHVFTGTFNLRTGVVCDMTLNCKDLPTAKGYIFEALNSIDQKCLDPELDPLYHQATITREEIAKAVAQYQELSHYLSRSKEFCLGFEPLSSGWPTVLKWVGLTASLAVAFKYLTDYNALWDDEIALRYPRGTGRKRDLDRLHALNKGKKRNTGFAYQRADLQLDDYLPSDRQAQTLENILKVGGNNVGHDRFLDSLLSGSTKESDVELGLARAESFLAQLQQQGPESFSHLDIQRELQALESLVNDNSATQGLSMSQIHDLLNQTGSDPFAGTDKSHEHPYMGAVLPAGYFRDMELSNENKPNRRNLMWQHEADQIEVDEEEEPDMFADIQNFDMKDGNLEELLGLAQDKDINSMQDDEFFEMLAKVMNHGAGKK